MIRAILVDDIELNLEDLTTRLSKFCKVIEVVASYTSIEEACTGIISHKPDVLFLDMEMPGSKKAGIEIAKAVKDVCPNVIFISAYGSSISQSYEVEALYYLERGELDEHLTKAIAKIQSKISERIKGIVWIKPKGDKPGPQTKSNRHKVKWKNIVCIELIGKEHLKIYTIHKSFETKAYIKDYQNLLDNQSIETQNLFWHINDHMLINHEFVAEDISEPIGYDRRKKHVLIPNREKLNRYADQKNNTDLMNRWIVHENRVPYLPYSNIPYKFKKS